MTTREQPQLSLEQVAAALRDLAEYGWVLLKGAEAEQVQQVVDSVELNGGVAVKRLLADGWWVVELR